MTLGLGCQIEGLGPCPGALGSHGGLEQRRSALGIERPLWGHTETSLGPHRGQTGGQESRQGEEITGVVEEMRQRESGGSELGMEPGC